MATISGSPVYRDNGVCCEMRNLSLQIKACKSICDRSLIVFLLFYHHVIMEYCVFDYMCTEMHLGINIVFFGV